MAPRSIRRLEFFPQAPKSLRDLEQELAVRVHLEGLIADAYVRTEVIGVGTQARVVAEPMHRAGAQWCAKEATVPLIAHMNRSPREEIALQVQAFDAITAAREADPNRPLARVPQPIAYVELDPPEGTADPIALIVMERIMGKTAFRALLEHITRADDRFVDLRSDLDHIGDTDLEQQFLTRLALRARTPREQLATIAQRGTRLGFTISRDTIIGIHRAITAFHDHGVFHRDAHPRNIMFPDDGGLPYIIDFGKSLAVAPSAMHGAFDPYEEHFGAEPVIYPNDGDFRAFLQQFAPKPGGA